MKKKKDLLVERFQQLANIHPLSEISPELKARAAQSAAQQGRTSQARKFGSAKDFGEKGEDSALADFIGKTFGREGMLDIKNAEVTADGFRITTLSNMDGSYGGRVDFTYDKNDDRLSIPIMGGSIKDIKDRLLVRQDAELLKRIIKIVNPESKLGNTHWASFKVDGAGIVKESKKLTKKVLSLIKEALNKRKLLKESSMGAVQDQFNVNNLLNKPLLGKYILEPTGNLNQVVISLSDTPDPGGKSAKELETAQIIYFPQDQDWDLSGANSKPSPEDQKILDKMGELIQPIYQKFKSGEEKDQKMKDYHNRP